MLRDQLLVSFCYGHIDTTTTGSLIGTYNECELKEGQVRSKLAISPASIPQYVMRVGVA